MLCHLKCLLKHDFITIIIILLLVHYRYHHDFLLFAQYGTEKNAMFHDDRFLAQLSASDRNRVFALDAGRMHRNLCYIVVLEYSIYSR